MPWPNKALSGIGRLRSYRGGDGCIQGILCSFVGLLVSTAFHFSRHIDWSWGLGLLATAALGALYIRVPGLFVLLEGIAAALMVR